MCQFDVCSQRLTVSFLFNSLLAVLLTHLCLFHSKWFRVVYDQPLEVQFNEGVRSCFISRIHSFFQGWMRKMTAFVRLPNLKLSPQEVKFGFSLLSSDDLA